MNTSDFDKSFKKMQSFIFGAFIFTVIGSLFRGENWSLVVPWK